MIYQRLRASPNFALTLAMDGRAYVAKQVEPYAQYWLNERERMLFALFARRGGMEVENAIDACTCITSKSDNPNERKRVIAAIQGMCEAGVLLGKDDDTSRYSGRMARDYLTHRPFPRPIAQHLITSTPVNRDTAVLDLAGGPGSLALELAQASDHVAMMELSKGFVAAARREARSRGVALNTLHDSCNRLAQHDGRYDVITISQALHWLDDVEVCKGVCRLLNADGSFFVVHGALSLPDDHPLAYVLGDHTPLGDKTPGSFAEVQVSPLLRRLALLFDALDAPDVERVDPLHGSGRGSGRIVPESVSLFRQERPIGEGFARAFLSNSHIAVMGQRPDEFWDDLTRRCAVATPQQRIGTQEWALLHFRRGGVRMPSLDCTDIPMIPIGWEGSGQG